MIHWHLNGQYVNQSSQVVINEHLNRSHLRSIIALNEPQERDLSTLQCFSFNSLGSASKQFCVSCLESSIENQGQFPKPIFIITVTAFLLIVCSLLFVVGFQKTRYKPQRIAGETGTVATGQRLMKKKNEVPNPNVDDFVEYGQSENVQPSSGTAVNCTSSLITHIPEETSRSSGVKSEDMVYASVIWSKKKKKKKKEEESYETMNPITLGEGGMHFVRSVLEKRGLYAEVKTLNVRKESESKCAQVQ
ncbi:hypothetical protein ATANTOWER_007816 [Ataeniobius toweri]|uniref:Ig-like domain-containing protein n=1 Tax=Ataeniobius toweri TaxID=208326 RepID=A0ABU7C9U3_9TELE|nr:hypothetical protein [Ataeniobius toweri]